MLVLDPSGCIERANDKFLAESGYKFQDIADLDLAIVSPPRNGQAPTAMRE
jgi:PAS domain-containing protein